MSPDALLKRLENDSLSLAVLRGALLDVLDGTERRLMILDVAAQRADDRADEGRSDAEPSDDVRLDPRSLARLNLAEIDRELVRRVADQREVRVTAPVYVVGDADAHFLLLNRAAARFSRHQPLRCRRPRSSLTYRSARNPLVSGPQPRPSSSAALAWGRMHLKVASLWRSRRSRKLEVLQKRERVNNRPGQPYRLEDIRATYKRRDAWWTVFLVDPLVARLMLPVANYTNITPNQISAASFVVGCLAAMCFAQGDYPALAGGAALYHLSFVLDCMDGKIARLKGSGSLFGMWFDYSFDRYRVFICAVALGYGQVQRSDDPAYIWLALIVVFLDMLRYMDALQVSKLRREMDRRLRAARNARLARRRGDEYVVTDGIEARRVGTLSPVRPRSYRVPATDASTAAIRPAGSERPDLNRDFRTRFRLWHRLREALAPRRVRAHLFSGIEYQMFIFIIGPLLDAVAALIVVSSAMLLTFELLIVYRLLLSTKEFEREIRRVGRGGSSELMTVALGRQEAPDTLDEPLDRDAAAAP